MYLFGSGIIGTSKAIVSEVSDDTNQVCTTNPYAYMHLSRIVSGLSFDWLLNEHYSHERQLMLKAASEYNAAFGVFSPHLAAVTQHKPLALPAEKSDPGKVGTVPREGGYPAWHVNSSISFLKKHMESWLSLGSSVSWITYFAVDHFLHACKALSLPITGDGSRMEKGQELGDQGTCRESLTTG